MSELLDGYRTALHEAHPLRLRTADREARVAVYKALIARWKPDTFTRHFPAIRGVMDRAYEEVMDE